MFWNVRREILPFVFVTIPCNSAKRISPQCLFVKWALWSCPLYPSARQSWKSTGGKWKTLVLVVFRQIKGKKAFESTSSQRTKTAGAQNTVKAYKVQMKLLEGETAYTQNKASLSPWVQGSLVPSYTYISPRLYFPHTVLACGSTEGSIAYLVKNGGWINRKGLCL